MTNNKIIVVLGWWLNIFKIGFIFSQYNSWEYFFLVKEMNLKITWLLPLADMNERGRLSQRALGHRLISHCSGGGVRNKRVRWNEEPGTHETSLITDESTVHKCFRSTIARREQRWTASADDDFHSWIHILYNVKAMVNDRIWLIIYSLNSFTMTTWIIYKLYISIN